MHGASRNYRYVWDVSTINLRSVLENVGVFVFKEDQYIAGVSLGLWVRGALICHKRIYNFCLLHACFV